MATFIRACRIANDVQHVAAQALGRLEFRPSGCAKTKLEGLDAARWEDLTAERHPDRHHDADGDDKVCHDKQTAHRCHSMQQRREPMTEALDPGARVRFLFARALALSQPPDREHRHQRAREEE